MSASTLPGGSSRGLVPPRHPRLALLLLFQVALLAAQYIAGMYLNLFAAIPPMYGSSGMMGNGMMAFMASPSMPALMFHMMSAVLILVAGTLVVIGASLARERSLLLVSLLALAGVVMAVVGGLVYLFYRADAASLGMAAGFLLAFGMTAWGLAIAWKGTPANLPPPPVVPRVAEA